MKKKILISPQSFKKYKQEINFQFGKNYEISYVDGPIIDKTLLLKKLKDKDAFIAGSENLSGDILKELSNLKLISRFGSGIDNVDTQFCKKKNIKIMKLSKKINATSVARHALSFLLNYTNNIYLNEESKKKIIWERKENLSPNLTKVGIIGLGTIGNIFANYASNLGFKINYFSRKNKKKKNFTYFNSINKLVKNSDIISLHVTSNSKTKYLFNKKNINILKNKIIINTSRGNLFEELPFYKELKKKNIIRAYLDVFINEPTISISRKIRKLKNVTSTCHTSFFDEQTIKNMVFISIKNTIEKLKKL